VAEQIFEWAGFAGVHLRIAAFFMENVLLIDGRDIRESGRIANAFGDCKMSWISGADVGAMAASLLANPDLAPERVIVAGGVEQLTYAQVAETIASVLSRPVIYEEVTPPAWREKLIAASTERGEPNIRGAEHLVAQSVALRSRPPLPVTDHVRKLVGRAPVSFAEFVDAHRAQLTPEQTVH
jgi:NAD(P)H dehydrogenase (quinone)